LKFKIVLFLILFSSFCFGLSFEELPKGIEIKGIVTIDGDIIGNVQIIEHTTFRFYEENAFENANYITLLDEKRNPIQSYEFPSDVKEVGKEFGEDIEFFPFQIIVPFEENVDSIAFANSKGNLKWYIERSENSPEIQIVSPVKGEKWNSVERIEWIMMDKDAEDWLLVDVYYADNSGLGWSLLAREVEGTEYILSEKLEATRIMLIVSDGFNSASAITESSTAKKSLDNKIDYELMETVFLADENQMLENDLNYQSKPFIPDENKTPPINPPPKTDDWIYLIAGFILVLVVAVAYGFMKKKK